MAILERTSILYQRLQETYPKIIGSEYMGEDAKGGTLYPVGGTSVRHESITELSFSTCSLDVIVHNDVLDHVFDYRRRSVLFHCAPETLQVYQHDVFFQHEDHGFPPPRYAFGSYQGRSSPLAGETAFQ